MMPEPRPVPIRIPHRAISASAGSGKTWQLAMRYITLLMLGEEPDRIVALTFSRKAAGEIFDRIMQMLAEALISDSAFEVLREAQPVPVTRGMVVDCIRRVLARLPRLRVGTLDSFAVGIVRAFPMELGIGHEFELMDDEGAAADAARQAVFSEVFHQPVSEKSRAMFMEAYKQATFGQEDKQFVRTLNGFLSAHHNRFRAVPDEEAWGRANRIWPEGSPWFDDVPDDIRSVGEALMTEVLSQGYNEKDKGRWETWMERFLRYRPGSGWKDVSYRVKKLGEAVQAWESGEAKLTVEGKGFSLTEPMQVCCLQLLHHIVRVDIATCLETTRGIYRVVSQFDAWYDRIVRQRGRLTFSDVQFLLLDPVSGQGRCSTVADDGRLMINYRLDGSLDHWLLDEFQDTSDVQWSVLKPLVSEAVQDPSGRRTFFYVGDVKQAIYGWRGGNAGLFRDVLQTYGAALDHDSLPQSRRSPIEIINAVNRVFRSPLPDWVNAGAAEAWTKVWETHTTAVTGNGYVGWLQPDGEDKDPHVCRELRQEVVAAALRRIEPHRRGLSVGILVRKNDYATALVAALRKACPDMPVVQDGPSELLNNELGQVLVSLVTLAAHPGDGKAWMHLRMSPLSGWAPLGGRNQLVLEVMDEIHEHGYEALFSTWCDRLASVQPLCAYGCQVRDKLLDAAAEFDRTAQKQPAAFVQYLDAYRVRRGGGSSVVRVMTLHQSKGLGFDVVILPELQDANVQIGTAPAMLEKAGETPGTWDWVLKCPHKDLAQLDEPLASVMGENESSNLFDTICGFYVAMTRAKKALLMVTTPRASRETKASEACWLEERLGGSEDVVEEWGGVQVRVCFEEGSSEWYETMEEMDLGLEPVQGAAPPSGLADGRRRRPRQVQPSREGDEEREAGRLFSGAAGRARTLGDAVHGIFEQVEWLDDGVDLDAVLDAWSVVSGIDTEIKQEAIRQVRGALQSAEVVEALTRPAGEDVEVWRERSFDVVFEEEWVSGTFDRVVLHRKDGGRLDSATILDFKSNHVVTEEEVQEKAEQYRSQLELYQRVLSKMVGLDRARIRLALVFTKPGLVVCVGDGV